MAKIIYHFGRLTWAQYRKQVAAIEAGMTGNKYFPTLQTQVAAMSAAAENYYVLDTKAEKRDKDVLLARNIARIDLSNLLKMLGFAVSSLANGSEEALASSGFPLSKVPQKSPPLQQPKPPKLSLGINNGVIKCKTVAQKGMKCVKYYITATTDTKALTVSADANWDVTTWNSTSYAFADLVPGQRYFVKVGMVGVRGQEVVSEPVSYIPQ